MCAHNCRYTHYLLFINLKQEQHKHFNWGSQLTSEEIAPVASAAYGVLLLGGGLFAYTRTQSKGSLYGGLTGAVLMGVAYFLMLAPDTKDLGEALAFGSALLFSSIFGIRLAATRKIVPAGPLLALSLGALVLFLSAYLQVTV
ncbi:protein FATTY ACID EXPORT 4, chloroplastic [Heracleum sosnowskyi]|uniref:Protein FATTY ACID EXPORT 4, chloroplastic n=1 Tax=Heracleum sosnowskyi TaxID=360622 RepID=A0AAD8MNF1_9APIA|nr:protein FATTY ACID EXPORT 4, chloroplastic [Heracleum sosnowskyi]